MRHIRNLVSQFVSSLSASYWYIPSLMAVLLGMLAVSLISFDTTFGFTITDYIPVSGDPVGAREIMSSLAGSIISMAATSFSITIVAMTLASQQFGPRLLDNFMRNRGNQAVLGIFISVPIYCLIVLWAIQSAEEAQFVPQIAVTVGVALGAIAFGALIYFIHHIMESIRVANIIADIAHDVDKHSEEHYPERIGQTPTPLTVDQMRSMIPDDFQQRSQPIYAQHSGYVVAVDSEALMDIARDNDLLIKLHHHPGEFVTDGSPIMQVMSQQMLLDDTRNALQDVLILGTERSHNQDIEFLFDKLSEMAVRALSPGINDPHTAMMCLDWMGHGLAQLLKRQLPVAYRYSDDAILRVIADETSYQALLRISFEQLRFYAREDGTVLRRLLSTLKQLAHQATEPDEKQFIMNHIQRTYQTVQNHVDPALWDMSVIEAEYNAAVAALTLQ